MTMPSRHRSRNALAALRSDGRGCTRISLTPLNASQKKTSLVETVRIDGIQDRVIEGSARRFLSALGGANLCHFAQPELIEVVDAALRSEGLCPIDNPAIDLSDLAARALERRGLLQARLTLDELAARHGIPGTLADASRTCPEAALDILAGLFHPFFLPELGQARGTYAPSAENSGFHLAPDDIFALAETARPAPELPAIAPPGGHGWRRGPWGTDEAIDCAIRFCRGETLAELSDLTRRSPRAIRARLALDGILTPGRADA